MQPATQTTEPQQAAIEALQRAFERDERVAAGWLEGSFGEGTADPWSDVDLHLAIDDQNHQSFVDNAPQALDSALNLLAHGRASLAHGTELLYATVAGPVRVDLYMERVSSVALATRLAQPKVLFDSRGIAESLIKSARNDDELRSWLQGLVENFFFGSMWPVRMCGRGEWGSLFMNSTVITYQFLVPAILAQESPDNYYRPSYHNERHLSAERRAEVYSLLERIASAFSGISGGRLDTEAIRAAHELLINAILRELRAACAQWNVLYPERAEAEIISFYERELRIQLGG